MITDWKDLVGNGCCLILLSHYPSTGLEGLRKTMKNLNQGSRSLGSRFQHGTSRIRSRSVNHSTATLDCSLSGTGWIVKYYLDELRLQMANSRIFVQFLSHISLNNINQLIFVMVKCCVLFEVWTEFFKYYLDELRLQRFNCQAF
jgi:hypothetical protein